MGNFPFRYSTITCEVENPFPIAPGLGGVQAHSVISSLTFVVVRSGIKQGEIPITHLLLLDSKSWRMVAIRDFMASFEFPSLCHLFQNQVEKDPNTQALVYKENGIWKSYTWQDWQERVLKLARGLKFLGIEKGDRIALISENRPEWTFTDLAILHNSALNCAIYTTSVASQVAYILKDSGSKVVFVSNQEHLKKILEIVDQVPELKWVVYFDTPEDSSLLKNSRLKIMSLNELEVRGGEIKEEEINSIWSKIETPDLASLIYTSGTTGDPKGVMLSHGNFLQNALGCRDFLSIEPNALTFSFLPLCHAFERMSGYYYAIAGRISIAYAESMEKIVDNLKEVKPTRFGAVPRVFEKIHAKVLDKIEKEGGIKKVLFHWAVGVGSEVSQLRRKRLPIPLPSMIQHALADRLVFRKFRKLMGGRVRFLISGGAPLAPEIGQFFDAVGLPILQGYGLTETSPVCTFNHLDDYRLDTVGRPLPGVQIHLAEDGEIMVKGDNVMKGYFRKPDETKKVLTKDGWFLTGDIGEIDKDGHLRITDRKKDIIVTAGGKNVAPQNIENKLKLDPMVEQACLIGDKRKYISALIVPNFENLHGWAKEKGICYKDNEDLIHHTKVQKLFQTVIDKMNADLTSFEQIKKFTLMPQEFTEAHGELTPTLKVKRRIVQNKYADLINQMY